MTGSTDEIAREMRKNSNVFQRPWQGIILNQAATVEDDIFVKVPGIDGMRRHGPCLWNPVAAAAGHIWLPGGGEICMVGWDDEKDPWILQWMPDSGSVKI